MSANKQYNEIKRIIQKFGLKPASQREISLFTVGCVALGYTKILNKKMGISYGAVIVWGRGDNTHFMFNEQHIGEEMGRFINKNFKHLDELTFKAAKEIYNKVQEQLRKAKKLSRIKPKESLKIIADIYPEYMGGIGIYNCYWRYLGNREKKGRLTPQLINRIAREREVYAKLYPQIDEFIKKIAALIGRQKKFNGDLLRFLTYTEMTKYLKNRLDIQSKLKTLEKRRDLYLYIYVEKENKEGVIVGKKLISKVYRDFYDIRDKSIDTIKGHIAYKGLAQGRVYNLVSPDKNKPNKDFILVTGMTHPKDIMLIKKSKAIITDQGGILSHAAIVSRELKKPCIIGTKIATKVLRDGQLVEVDANKGVVRILRKK